MANPSLTNRPPADSQSSDVEQNEYLIVRVDGNGRFSVQGSREEVAAFLQACAEIGIWIDLDYLSWCG